MRARKSVRRAAALWAMLLPGCSTAPVVDLLDYFKPGKIRGGQGAPYGGVCLPQGAQLIAPQPTPPPPGPGIPLPLAPQPPAPQPAPVPPAPQPELGPPVVPQPGIPEGPVPPTRPFTPTRSEGPGEAPSPPR